MTAPFVGAVPAGVGTAPTCEAFGCRKPATHAVVRHTTSLDLWCFDCVAAYRGANPNAAMVSRQVVYPASEATEWGIRWSTGEVTEFTHAGEAWIRQYASRYSETSDEEGRAVAVVSRQVTEWVDVYPAVTQ